MHKQENTSLFHLFWGQSPLRRVTVLLLLALCLTSVISIPFYVAASTPNLQTYVDQKLGFSLQFPTGWEAIPQPGRANNQNTAVTFLNPERPETLLQVGVMRRASAATDFAKRGKPTVSMGTYSAFQADTQAGKQMPVPCLNRIMLAHDDTVIASWCSPDASAHKQEFENILSTYRDFSTTSNTIHVMTLGMSQAPSTSLNTMNALAALNSSAALGATPTPTSTMTRAPIPVNSVETCSQVMQNPGLEMWGTLPTNDPNFGQQIVNPTDTAWTNSFGEGVAVCNDDNWENSYLFQCVELANRFINEEWGLPSFTMDAFAYYDYYLNGTKYLGQARTLFGNEVQLTDDASQGNNAAFPVPGDLLVFQDVTNPSQGWTSGEIANDPGHVAIVTSVTSTQVNVVQQNWQNGETWSFPLQHLSNGYHVVDNSGITGRITRGWIHFSANSKRANYTSMAPNSDGRLEAFGRGSDNTIWHNYQTAPGGSWTGWSSMQAGQTFNGDPVVGVNADGMLEIFARGSDNNIWTTWQNTVGSSTSWVKWVALPSSSSSPPLFQGTPAVAVNADGRMEIFARASDGTMWHNYQTSANGSWNGWNQLSTQVFTSDPAISVNADGHMEVFARGTDNNIYHTWETTDSSSSSWYNWVLLQSGSSYQFQGTPSVALNSDGRLEIVARGSDGTIWHNYQTSASGSWNGWSQLASQTFNGDPAIIANADGHLEMFARGADNNIYHTWETTNGSSTSWYSWVLLQSGSSYQFQGTPAIAPDSMGRLVIMAIGPNSNIWTNYQNTINGTWNGWVLLTPNTVFQQ